MSDIYQQIWDADQNHAGLKAIRKGDPVDTSLEAHGYVVVNEDRTNVGPAHRLIEEAVFPDSKRHTYNLVKKLFNNYTLDQTKRERDFPEEEGEVQDFIEAVYKSGPMDVARAYIEERTRSEILDDQWWAILQRLWFERFDMGQNKDLSGFEHVVVGEQKQGKVQGYHSWFKYYLDERFRRGSSEAGEMDLIKFLSWKGLPTDRSPDVATLSYVWHAFDYEAEKFRPLTKPIGGFWIGPSVEGLLALATVRALNEAMAPREATINGVRYNLVLHRSPNNRHIRTFYPEFLEMVEEA